jgi:AraC family transcriptional regulator of adaptative response / DNA-3-methyladenine glycosylase II
MLSFLAERAIAGVESCCPRAYRRTVAIDECRGWISVEQADGRDQLSVDVSTSLLPVLPKLLAAIRRLFDVASRPDLIAEHLSADPRLTDSVESEPGLRVPGALDAFELLTRAIVGQQISVRAASTLAGRMASSFGETFRTPFNELNRLSPQARTLAGVRPTELASLGLTPARAETLQRVSQVVAAGALDLTDTADPERFVRQLTQQPGIGDWTAQYVAMRAVPWPDAFPAGDLGLLKAAGQSSPRRLCRVAEQWRPWRAYAAAHLWHSLHLVKTGANNAC